MHHPPHLPVLRPNPASFEAETSKPRCRRVSPRLAILTTGKSLPVPLHSDHLVTCIGFPLALTRSSRRLHQPDGFKAKPSETSVSLAFSTCQHGSPLTSPGLPIVRPPSPKLVPDPRHLTIKWTPSTAHITRQANTTTLVPKVSVKQPVSP